MSSLIPEEIETAALIELCNLLGRPSFARDIAAAYEMTSITGKRIAIAGLVKRGKSTFVNRVVGQNLSPVNLLPETSSVLCFTRGEQLRASGISFDGRFRKLSTKPNSFCKDVSRKARKPLLAASYCGHLKLPVNFCLVDTPGAYETEVIADSLVESGMPPSLFHLCGGFIVVMGVPGLSAVDLQLLERINKSAGQLPVRVLLKGLDSSISQVELLEYSKEVLSEVKNEIYVVTDENFDEASRLIDSFSISYSDYPKDALEVSELVVKLVLNQISEVLDTRDELNEIVAPKSLMATIPPEIAEKVRYFAPGARERRLREQEESARQASEKRYKSGLNAWMIKNQELRRAVTNADQEVREAERNLRREKPKNASLGCSTAALGALGVPISIIFPPFILFGVVLWIIYAVTTCKGKAKFKKIEMSLIARVNAAKSSADLARKLLENHQKIKPNRGSQ